MKRQGLIWLVPAIAILMSIVVLVWTGLERQRVLEELDDVLKAHAQSVAQLIQQSTSEATTSIDLIYTLLEENLRTIVQLLGRLDKTHPNLEAAVVAAGLRVWIIEEMGGRFEGTWGAVPREDRAALFQTVTRAGVNEIVESEQTNHLGLYCAHFTMSFGHLLACKDLKELTDFRRKTGFGALFDELAKKGVVYAAVQDETGVLAGSPGVHLSAWRHDPVLAEVPASSPPGMRFRNIPHSDGDESNWHHRPLLEGLVPLPLPDGSIAVLRIGIDASSIETVRAEIASRYLLLVLVLTALVVVSVAGGWIFSRWDKRNQETKRQLALNEEQNRHWQEIGHMAATVAHEVRNPLNTLKMAAQRLSREFEVKTEDRDDYRELVTLLQSESDRVNHVVSEFLELGRPLTLSVEKTTMAQAMEEALTPLRLRAAHERKTIETDIRYGGEVFLDRRRFGQIVSNIVGNALDAVPERGIVRITAQNNETRGLSLVIEDNGPGIAPEMLEEVQRPFVTTKAKGIGLGLPLAHRLVQAHGGRLELQSQPGRGTRARIFLPTKQDSAS